MITETLRLDGLTERHTTQILLLGVYTMSSLETKTQSSTTIIVVIIIKF